MDWLDADPASKRALEAHGLKSQGSFFPLQTDGRSGMLRAQGAIDSKKT